jgi:leucyl/phenylalanyl-tRNA--protein transferase
VDVRRVTHGLDVEMLEHAYRQGLFPMAHPGEEYVTWHRPRLRAILPLDQFHVSRSLARTLRCGAFEVTFDRDFDGVMVACSEGRSDGTWISDEFRQVYGELHRSGRAHSVEVWAGGALAGGVYGVHLGGAFFAESKFHRVRDMSKVALAHLVFRLRERGFALLDVQYWTGHLAQFGVIEIPHQQYARRLAAALPMACSFA